VNNLDLKKNIQTIIHSNQNSDVHNLKFYKSNFKSKHTINNPTVKNALNSNEKLDWIKEINREISYIIDNKILLPVDTKNHQLPHEYDFIFTTTKLKRKFKPCGSVDKLKARTCARGDQLINTDNNNNPLQNYSPTITDSTFMLLLQLSIIYDWKKENIDTVSAFLHQKRPLTAKPTVYILIS
jgi:hypothetical protein